MNTLGFELIEKWYQLDQETLFRKFQLSDTSQMPFSKVLDRLPISRSGMLCGIEGLVKLHSHPFICSGICITDSIPSLTLECLAKIYNLVFTAKSLGATPILFVGVHGETLKFPSLSADWNEIYERASRLVQKLAIRFNLPSYKVCNTDDFHENSVIKQTISNIEEHVSRDALIQMYEIGPFKGNDVQGTTGQIRATLSCIAFNCASVLSSIYGTSIEQLIFLEDIQQIKVIQYARQVDHQFCVQNEGSSVGIYFCPIPSLTGEGRMYRSHPNHKIYTGDSVTKLTYQFASMSTPLLNFWKTFFSDWDPSFVLESPKDFAHLLKDFVE